MELPRNNEVNFVNENLTTSNKQDKSRILVDLVHSTEKKTHICLVVASMN